MNKMNIYITALLVLLLSVVSQDRAVAQNFNLDFQKILDAYVVNGLVAYENPALKADIEDLFMANGDLLSQDEILDKATLINIYNAAVIREVVRHYPLTSPQDLGGFFDRKVLDYGGEMYSLDEFEKGIIFNKYNDPRLHFALVCAAISCPKLSSEVYQPNKIEAQLDMITRAALDDPRIFRSTEKTISLSNIFRWYADDFDDLTVFFAKYDIDINDRSIKYLPYDWTLNDQVEKKGNNSFRYISSSTVRKGGFELKIFNNLYSQVDPSERSNFFTQTTSFVYGFRPNFNIGFDLRYRRVNYLATDTSPFEVLGDLSTGGSRFSNVGPKIRWAPNPRKFPNFSIQSAFWFSTSSDNEALAEQRFLDWSHGTWITQFFNDFTFGDKYSLFTELDFIWEDIGADQFNRVSVPATAIFSYFPIKNWTIYGLGQYSPFIQNPYDYFYQYGIGTKYQFTRDLELEISYTSFSNDYLNSVNGSAATYNIGIRYSKN